ncbi:MAG TPA: LamG-like jellyroll fold domain-containing protein, partial [Verrucomicrobiae bacterium]|nr:LamG-like jellyroll fold domain-containing protein [Verrucomicrobiae bacterium]
MKATQPVPIAVFSSRFAIAGSRSVTCRQCRRSDLYHLSPGIILALVIAVVLGKSFAARAQTCTNAPSGLVAWYQGEGNANDSAGTANAIFFNPGYAAGEVGQAFSFNGTSSFAEIPVVPALNFTNNNPMSIEFWAYRTGTASTMELLGKRGSACGAIQYEISLTPGAGLAFDTSGGSVATGYQLPTNAWVHLAVSFDGTNILFYTNGILAATGTGQLGAANGAPVYLGTSSSCPGFVGLLDEISFYNRALAASEIQGIFAVGSAGKCPLPPVIVSQPQSQTVPAGTNVTFTVVAAGASPLSYQWQFDSTNLAGATISSLTITNVRPSNTGNYSVVVSNAGGSVTSFNAILAIANCYADPPGLISWWPGEGNANDKFGTNNGILVGGVTFGPGEVGQAFQFNGASTQYVDVPTSASLNPTANLTLEAWIYPQLP